MEDLDDFELELKRERAEKRSRNAKIMAAVATVMLLGSVSAAYSTGFYQGASLDPVPCDPAEVEALARDGWTIETVDVDGAVLTGLERVPDEPDAPWVLYFGGNQKGSLRTARAYLERLVGRGTDVGAASFANRGFDTSTGVTKPSLLKADARAVFDHLVAKHGVRAPQLHVIGFSLGANSAALLGEELAGTEHVLASTTLLSPGIAPHKVPTWAHPLVVGAFELPSKLKAMRGPVLLVAASDDPAYPPDIHARRMTTLLGDRLVRYLEVPGGHEGPLRDEASLAVIRTLLDVEPSPTPETTERVRTRD